MCNAEKPKQTQSKKYALHKSKLQRLYVNYYNGKVSIKYYLYEKKIFNLYILSSLGISRVVRLCINSNAFPSGKFPAFVTVKMVNTNTASRVSCDVDRVCFHVQLIRKNDLFILYQLQQDKPFAYTLKFFTKKASFKITKKLINFESSFNGRQF